jgi:hypothetical protein
MLRDTAVVRCHGRPARVHELGGGTERIRITAGRLRANLGDAERYAHDLLAALAVSGPGQLGVEDRRGQRHTWAGAVCVEASAAVRAFRFVELDCLFRAPESPSSPDWAGAPAPPDTYPKRSTAQDYAAGGVDLGIGGTMCIEMERTAPLRTVPRARGARPRPAPSGAIMRFQLDAHANADTDHLAAHLEDMARSIGTGPVDLTANGNSFSSLVLEELRPDNTDVRATSFRATFLRQL